MRSLVRRNMAATGGGCRDCSSEKARLQDEIRRQGDVVRQMKKDSKPKEEVNIFHCTQQGSKVIPEG